MYSATIQGALTTVAGGDELATTRALKWHLVTHRLLLHISRNGAVGGRQWAGSLRARFRHWQDCDFTRLVRDWQTDSNRTSKPPKILQGQALKTANANEAAALALDGDISRAVRKAEATSYSGAGKYACA